MKRDRPLLDTLRWVLVGGVVGLILYIGHLFLLHQDEEEMDDHPSYSSQNGQR